MVAISPLCLCISSGYLMYTERVHECSIEKMEESDYIGLPKVYQNRLSLVKSTKENSIAEQLPLMMSQAIADCLAFIKTVP